MDELCRYGKTINQIKEKLPRMNGKSDVRMNLAHGRNYAGDLIDAASFFHASDETVGIGDNTWRLLKLWSSRQYGHFGNSLIVKSRGVRVFNRSLDLYLLIYIYGTLTLSHLFS